MKKTLARRIHIVNGLVARAVLINAMVNLRKIAMLHIALGQEKILRIFVLRLAIFMILPIVKRIIIVKYLVPAIQQFVA